MVPDPKKARPLLATHLVWGCYGFWLPNDPRGSWSRYVGCRKLHELAGSATTVNTRRSLAKDAHDRGLQQRAKETLPRPPIRLTGVQALEVARGFARAVEEAGFVLHACALLPDHVHVVVAPHAKRARQIVGHLKSRASRQLRDAGHTFGGRPWVKYGWAVYLFDDAAVRRAIRYVEQNPVKDGLRRQHWTFVRPYEPDDSHR